jgi:hypothetical protein
MRHFVWAHSATNITLQIQYRLCQADHQYPAVVQQWHPHVICESSAALSREWLKTDVAESLQRVLIRDCPWPMASGSSLRNVISISAAAGTEVQGGTACWSA